MSTHDFDVGITAAKSGIIDVIMIQINLANHASSKREEFLIACTENNIGVIAMKPFAGGRLLQANKTVTFAAYQTAGQPIKKTKISNEVNSAQCLHYILNQIGISSIVPGVANMKELHDVLNYYNMTDEAKDYSDLLTNYDIFIEGECVYCNHCQPCPADIDIGPMFRIYDKAQNQDAKTFQEEYDALKSKASDCIECGKCIDRCPFDVQVIIKMKEVAAFFGK
jgi:hypothetical protein